MSVVGELDEQFPDYSRLLDDLARMLQRIAVFQVVGSVESDEAWDDAELAKLADSIGEEDVQLFYQIAVTGRRDLYLAPDPRSGVEMTLLRMLAFQPGGAVRQQTAVKEKSATRRSAVPVASKVELAATEVPAEAASWQEPDWTELMPRLDLTAVSRQLASNCAYLRREGDTVYLSLDSRSESYLTREREQKLAAALSNYFGEKLKVDIAVGDVEKETPVQTEKRMEVEEIDAARAGLEADPNVRALKDMFGAELVADSVEPLSDK